MFVYVCIQNILFNGNLELYSVTKSALFTYIKICLKLKKSFQVSDFVMNNPRGDMGVYDIYIVTGLLKLIISISLNR